MKKELIVLPFLTYNKEIIQIASETIDKRSMTCYVTLNKTFRSLLHLFEKNKIKSDDVHFIDLITPKILKFDPHDKCIFLESIDDLNEFADIVLNEVKMNKAKTLIFDSVSSFLVYHSEDEVIDFFNYMVPLLEELGVDITLIALRDDSQRPAIKQLAMLADNTRFLED